MTQYEKDIEAQEYNITEAFTMDRTPSRDKFIKAQKKELNRLESHKVSKQYES